MSNLPRRCIFERETETWVEFWVAYAEAAARPMIRSRLLARGRIHLDADDVTMQLMVHLLEFEARRLKSFAGDTTAEFRAWLFQVVANFTHKLLRDAARSQRRTQAALSITSPPDRSGPTESEVLARLAELESAGIASPTDARKLRILGGAHKPQKHSRPRTHQLWTKQLLEKLREHLT